MINSASNGMTSIIEAAVENRVKRIVVTSTFLTMLGPHWKRPLTEYQTYNEADYTPYNGCEGYTKSKIVQENICREFLKK